MKITLEHAHYIFVADLNRTLKPDEDPDNLPELQSVVDSALFLISLYYSGEKVQEQARKWGGVAK